MKIAYCFAALLALGSAVPAWGGATLRGSVSSEDGGDYCAAGRLKAVLQTNGFGRLPDLDDFVRTLGLMFCGVADDPSERADAARAALERERRIRYPFRHERVVADITDPESNEPNEIVWFADARAEGRRFEVGSLHDFSFEFEADLNRVHLNLEREGGSDDYYFRFEGGRWRLSGFFEGGSC